MEVLHLKERMLTAKKNGAYKWYYENGKLSAQQFYKKGIIVNTTLCYYESGKLKRLVSPPIKDSLKYAIEFYETGEKKIETYLLGDDFIDKSWVGFFKNGQIKKRGLLEKGLKKGVWEFYFDNGVLEKKEDQTGQSKYIIDLE